MHLALTLTGGPNLEGRKADSILSNGPFTLVDSKIPLLKPNYLPKFSLDDYLDIGRIHLVHLRIHKYFVDDSSVNFLDMFFLHFLL